ncbi:MAG: hypothetical protein FMNOHCHN_03595 [Ignavibacteriaceae bacterium]|nr:hypothetical protein [Ignavibacteriaceae bacterium]
MAMTMRVLVLILSSIPMISAAQSPSGDSLFGSYQLKRVVRGLCPEQLRIQLALGHRCPDKQSVQVLDQRNVVLVEVCDTSGKEEVTATQRVSMGRDVITTEFGEMKTLLQLRYSKVVISAGLFSVDFVSSEDVILKSPGQGRLAFVYQAHGEDHQLIQDNQCAFEMR